VFAAKFSFAYVVNSLTDKTISEQNMHCVYSGPTFTKAGHGGRRVYGRTANKTLTKLY